MPNKIVNTEVGPIPSDWKLVRYGQIFDFCRTASYSRELLSDTDETGYVHYGDIHTKFDFFLDLNKVILPTIGKESTKNFTLLRDGDLIMADASEDYEGIGKSVEVKNVRDKKVIAGLHTLLLRDKNESVANGFKGYIHANQLVKKQINTLATGLKVYGISKNNLKRILIPLPPTTEEQTAIAEALSDADALITSLERLIAKKKAIKQGAMQRLLKTKGSSSEQGLPVTWNITELRHGINLISGQHILSHRVNSEGIGFPYITGPADFPKGTIDTNKYAVNPNSVCEKNDILITVKGSGTGKIAFADKRYAISRQLMAIRGKNQWDQRYLFHLLVAHISHFSDASAGLIPGISREDILKLEIHLPSNKSEQTAISTTLDTMDAEINLLEQKLEKQKLIKQGMMQVLLTGKVRLL